jgi:DNA-binding NarL/FixJ family response regulator
MAKRIDILIVEDRPVMRAMLREFVQNAFPDCAILDAANGARAMDLLVEHRPQLVLMDVCLPDANGIELTARIKAAAPGVAVIVISYLDGQAYVEQALAAGASTYVSKDRLLSELIPAIAGVLDPHGGTFAGQAI